MMKRTRHPRYISRVVIPHRAATLTMPGPLAWVLLTGIVLLILLTV